VGWGWRLGPLIADTPPQADALLASLLAERGFTSVGETLRMYRGPAPRLPLAEIYGLACLELG
jgi:ribosomal-protein-alanine N-acetyltransferase